MDQSTGTSGESTPTKAQHLCVLVHGLWGTSQHLWYISQSLQEAYGEDQLIVLACQRNASFFTYDGIEIGGERLTKEIEDKLEELGKDGYKITRLSMVGYSLGGLVARYAIGLLYHKGYFDHIQPVNFTTFATPHLGVRTPRLGYASHLFNVLGARTLSASGRQLFAIDNFRDTGRPLLSILADHDSIFIRALARFERRTLYANIVNDRTVVWYTSSISKINPYVALDKLKLNYVKGYGSVILDHENPWDLKEEEDQPNLYQRMRESSLTFFSRVPVYLALSLFIPIGITVFFINSPIQTFRSRKRILLHESDSAGEGFGVYKIPFLVREVRAGLEEAFEITNAEQGNDYLPDAHKDADYGQQDYSNSDHSPARKSVCPANEKEYGNILAKDSDESMINHVMTNAAQSDFPTLALTEEQFDMIKELDSVGFRKFPVHIHQSGHTHAAIIVRNKRGAFSEGKRVIQHWLDNEFHL